jgi:hypothetical protein
MHPLTQVKGMLISWLVSLLPFYHATLANLLCQSSREAEWGIKSLGFLTTLIKGSTFVALLALAKTRLTSVYIY